MHFQKHNFQKHHFRKLYFQKCIFKNIIFENIIFKNWKLVYFQKMHQHQHHRELLECLFPTLSPDVSTARARGSILHNKS